MKTAIVYGSTTGKTRTVAALLTRHFPGADLWDVGRLRASDLLPYQVVLFGTSTWGTGKLQDHWERQLPHLPPSCVAGKTLGFFGLGDQTVFADTFCAGLTRLKNHFGPAAARLLEPALVLDHDNRAGQTEALVTAWAQRLKEEGLS